MKHFVHIVFIFSAVTLYGADRAEQQTASFDMIAQMASPFELSEDAVTIVPVKLMFTTHAIRPCMDKDCTHPIRGSTEDYSVEAQNCNVSEMSKHSMFCCVPTADPIWSNANTDSPVIYQIHYTPKSSCKRKCVFELRMFPRDSNRATSYFITLCADTLSIKHPNPLMLNGLEHPRFKNLTALTIIDCNKLSGTGGALNNILAVLQKLKHLNLTNTKLDDTVIDAEHTQLKRLYLKGSNCTEIKRIVMPQLKYLNLEHNPLPHLDHTLLKVPSLGCIIKT